MDNVVICGASRTPMGGFQGCFSDLTASDLGGVAIEGALQQAGVDPDRIDELLMGCVLPAGQGQAPARQAGFKAKLGKEVPATTLNKMCGSGMKAAMIAYDQLALGASGVVIAGGMESMTNAPYLIPNMRKGARIGHGKTVDHMFLDGLEDAYAEGRLMGTFAEDCAEKFGFTREAQDEYALRSLSRALEAQRSGAFSGEVTPVSLAKRYGEVTVFAGVHNGKTVVAEDEQPANARPEKIPHLRAVFRKNGTVTPANASSISDGAAALVLANEGVADRLGVPKRARIVGHASHAQEPGWFTTAPVPAAEKLLARLGWRTEDVDLWEVNEAFAVVPMAFMEKMQLSPENVNIHGGACALGHPIGASGARIIVSLLNALELRGQKRGVAAICIGGGEGTAIAIERI